MLQLPQKIGVIKNMENRKVRVQKVIADLGYTSRRKAEELLKSGAVTANGKILKLGDKISPNEKIVINGKNLTKKSKKNLYNAKQATRCCLYCERRTWP